MIPTAARSVAIRAFLALMLVSLVLVPLVLMPLALQGNRAARERKDMQGTWQPIEVIDDGKVETAEELKDFRMFFDGDTFSLEKEGMPLLEGTFQLDASTNPKIINMKFQKGPPDEDYEGKTATGIYKIEGDTLTWCITKPGVENRPTDFTSREGAGRMLVTLKRDK